MNELRDLRKEINIHFNLEEIRVICFDLPVNYEEISGESKSSTIINLIDYCKRHNKLDDLVMICSDHNKNFNWNLEESEVSQNELGAITTKLRLSLPPNKRTEYEQVIHEYLEALRKEFNIPAISLSLNDSEDFYIERNLNTFVEERYPRDQGRSSIQNFESSPESGFSEPIESTNGGDLEELVWCNYYDRGSMRQVAACFDSSSTMNQ
jgi:hypothetical protein